jgi:hypothetical protein
MREFSKRFEALANRLSGKKRPPEWMVLTVVQKDIPEKIIR